MYAFVAESVGTAEKMLIDDSASPFNIFGNGIVRYIGGKKPHIRLQGRHGMKLLYLGGYSTARDWKKILGLNIHGIHIEELSAAHDDFLREAFVRVSRLATKPWLLGTTNGGEPNQAFYTEFFDKGNYNNKHNINMPVSTKQILDNVEIKDDRFEYIFVGFEDSPTQTEEIINDIKNTFPPGTFWYNSKVLGARSALTGAIYAEYIDKQKHVIEYNDIFDKKKYNFIRYSIGVDVGTSAYTVFYLTGFTVGFKEAVVIDTMKINQAGTDEIYDAFKTWYEPYYINPEIHNRMFGIFVDYGGGGNVLIKSLQNKILDDYNIQMGNAHKIKIVDRIESTIKLLYANRLLFTDRTTELINSMTSVVYSKNRDKTDPREWTSGIHKDNVDSFEYSLSGSINVMLRRS